VVTSSLLRFGGGSVDVAVKELAAYEAVVRECTARVFGRPIAEDYERFEKCLGNVSGAVAYHQQRFAEAGHALWTQDVIRRLRRGKMAYGPCRRCDLLEDAVLMLLLELGHGRAVR